MIPFGYPFNFEIYDKLKPGDYIHFKDQRRFKVRTKITVFTNSPIAECMAQMIYNKPMKEVFKEFKDRYKNDIQDERVIIIVYEPKDFGK